MTTRAEMASVLKEITEKAGGESPEAIVFWCKGGGERIATMEGAFEPCEGCDCGWSDLLAYTEVTPEEIRDAKV
jgi:hypothetical protein